MARAKKTVPPLKKGGGQKGKRGQPPHKPTDENRRLVETHAACGTPQWLIAQELSISEPTLLKYYQSNLDTGLLRINARMASLIAKQGLMGCRPSQSLWMKTRGGWAEKQSLVHTGPNGQPITLAAAPRNADLKKLTDDEVQEYLRIQAKLEGVELLPPPDNAG